MLTENQKDAFRRIKTGGLNPKQKGDFYYRMSKILKDELEGLNDVSYLLDELPKSYLEKIDLKETAVAAIKLTEKLIKKIGPVKVKTTKDGSNALRRYQIAFPRMALPDLSDIVATIQVSYEPDEKEIALFKHLNNVVFSLNHLINEAVFDSHTYTSAEFDKNVLPIIKSKKNYKIKFEGFQGNVSDAATFASLEDGSLQDIENAFSSINDRLPNAIKEKRGRQGDLPK
jgi:hypothetical protein